MFGLKKGEKILSVSRRHLIIIAAHIAMIFALIFFLITGLVIMQNFFPILYEAPFIYIVALIFLLALLMINAYFFLIWTDYHLDVWIITNERIIDIEQKGLFRREFSEFKIERVQDVSVDVNGIIPTFFNYGDVHIQTAGEAREFVFRQIPNPYRIKTLVLKTHDKARDTYAKKFYQHAPPFMK